MKAGHLITKVKSSGISLLDRLNLNIRTPETNPLSGNEQNVLSTLIHLKETPVQIPGKDVQHFEKPVYHKNILKLLDDLQCPVVLLPLVTNERSDQRIGFFTDILFTGTSTIALLVKIAKSFQATITIFNLPEPSLPQMDPEYAERYFNAQGMSKVNGFTINLVNLKKGTTLKKIESTLCQHNITIVASMQQRKDLLYKLVS
ncbi:MAG TPA: hypothetical protein VGD22_12840 [Sphingobacteriaceae bacterium]